MIRSRLVLIGASLLIAIGCGHRSASTIPTTTTHTVSIPTAKSVSPASIAAPPMAKTAILPSSVMSAMRRPKSEIVPVGWNQLPGGAIVVAASTDGSLWVLSSLGNGPDRAIWHYLNGAWYNIPGAAMRLSVGPDGTLWAVNSLGGIYAWNGSSWSTIAGGASDISAAPDGSVYVISNQGGGPYGRGIWHYAGGAWSQLPGAAVRVAASWETATYPNGIVPGGVWVINAQNAVFYYSPGIGFTQYPGGLVEIAPTKLGGLFGLGYAGNGDGTYPIYYNDLATQNWALQQGAASTISSNSTSVYVTGAAGGIYSASIGVAATTAAIAFAGPASDPHVSGSQAAGYQLIGNQGYTFTATALDRNGNPITVGGPRFTVQSNSSALTVTPLAGTTNAYVIRARRYSPTPVTINVTASNSNVTINVPFTTIQELWVANSYNSTITAYAGQPPVQVPADTMTTASGLLGPSSIVFDDLGRMWVANYQAVKVYAGSLTAPADTLTAGLSSPSALAFDANGTLWVANWGPGTGSVTSYSGTTQLPGTISNPDGAITGLYNPRFLAFDNSGTLWISNAGGNVRTVTAYSGVSQLTGQTIAGIVQPWGLAVDGSGAMWVTSSYTNTNTIDPYNGSSLIYGNTISSGLNSPAGIAFDAMGNLWVANNGNNTITAYAGGSQITSDTISAGLSGPIGITFAPPATLPVNPPPPHPSPPPPAVIANPSSVAFSTVGTGFQFVYVTQAGYWGDYSMTNSNPSVASAEQVGASTTVRPLAAGTTTLHITGGFGQSVDVPVTVSPTGNVVVAPSSLSFTNVGAAYSRTVAIGQANYSGAFGFFIFDPTVVSASITGNTLTVTPLNSGSTVVRVGGGNSQFADVSVGVTVTNINLHTVRRGAR